MEDKSVGGIVVRCVAFVWQYAVLGGEEFLESGEVEDGGLDESGLVVEHGYIESVLFGWGGNRG